MTGALIRGVVAVMIVVAVFVAGVIVGGNPVASGLTRLPDPLRGALIGEAEGNLTSQVLRILDDNYYREIDEDELDVASVDRIIADLDDPFTDYLTPEEYRRLQDRNDGRYTGVGVQVSLADGRIQITRVFDGGPAADAGLRAGDRVVAVDGRPVDPATVDADVERIRGPEGTPVTLRIARDGEPPFDVELTRARIAIELTESELRRVGGTPIAHVHLRQFARGAGDAVREDVEGLVEQGAEGVVLDLRGNPGGLVSETVEVAEVFLPSGSTVVTTEGRTVEERTLETEDAPVSDALPLIVLVDAGSASASEIVAGALRDDRRARLVGHRTFGKALVQGTRELRDGGALKLTIARYRTPSGQDINEKGLVPGVRVVDDPATPRRDEALQRALAEAARSPG